MFSTKNISRRSENCFDFIRVAAALAVLYSHSFALIGRPEPQPIAGQTFGSLAVALFFAISGFLVCQSWSRDPSPGRFAGRRALRIIPALLVVVILTALVIGPIFSTLSLKEYFLNKKSWSYIPYTLFFLGVPPLPGLFEDNYFPNSNNGSLWTLRYEVLMYAVLAMAGNCLPRSKLKFACITLLFVFSVAWIGLTAGKLTPYQIPFVWRLGTELYGDRIFNLGAFFFAGCCIYLYFEKIRISLLFAVFLIIISIIITDKNIATPILWIALPYGAVAFAYRAPSAFQKMNGFDCSYGIYIYAFPVQQIVSHTLTDVSERWFTSLVISALITIILAALSWHFIERPALSLKDSLISKRTDFSIPRTSESH